MYEIGQFAAAILCDEGYKKRQESLGNFGTRLLALTHLQDNDYDTSSGDDEGNCVYNLAQTVAEKKLTF